MALPLLNETPQYEMKIPSTGKKIRFRPYLVKEEKILMLAAESKDINQITSAILDTIHVCTDGKVNRRELTTFDVEYMFLQLRAKSVGENVALRITCEECDHQNEHTVNIDEIKCEVHKKNNLIEISDTVTVEMKYPGYDMLDFEQDPTDAGFAILAKCIKSVIVGEEKINLADESEESINNFIGSMTQAQFEKVTSFIQDMPAVQHNIDFTCEGCGHKNIIELKGMQSFF